MHLSCQDVDHKVRELSQRATASLASQTGKAMAPHLKSIMGMWMVSMCDTYPTVASAANQAFISRFPEAKQAEAIRFCLEEIVEVGEHGFHPYLYYFKIIQIRVKSSVSNKN